MQRGGLRCRPPLWCLWASRENAARAEAAIEQAERDLAEQARVNMRWSKAQLEVVKRAAALFGVPYQTYVKQAAFRAALDDLMKVREAGKKEGAA